MGFRQGSEIIQELSAFVMILLILDSFRKRKKVFSKTSVTDN